MRNCGILGEENLIPDKGYFQGLFNKQIALVWSLFYHKSTFPMGGLIYGKNSQGKNKRKLLDKFSLGTLVKTSETQLNSINAFLWEKRSTTFLSFFRFASFRHTLHCQEKVQNVMMQFFCFECRFFLKIVALSAS